MWRNITKRPGKRASLVGASVKGDGRVRALEAHAGDAAAGYLAGDEGLAVFVGEVEEAVRLGGLFQPMDEGFHLGADDILCASEADADDYERHVGDTKVAFGAFPQEDLNGASLAEVVETGSDRVPVKHGIIGVAAEYICDICAEVEEEVYDDVAGCGFDFLHVWCWY